MTTKSNIEEDIEALAVPILECDAYTFKVLRMADQKYIIHIDIHDWSVSTLKSMKGIWPHILESFYNEGVDALYTIVSEKNTRTEKLCGKFGLAPLNKYDVLYDDGSVSKVYIFKIPTNIEEFA